MCFYPGKKGCLHLILHLPYAPSCTPPGSSKEIKHRTFLSFMFILRMLLTFFNPDLCSYPSSLLPKDCCMHRCP